MRSLFAVGHLRNEKGAEAKMCPVNVFGIDTGPGRGGVLGLIFAGYVLLASQSP